MTLKPEGKNVNCIALSEIIKPQHFTGCWDDNGPRRAGADVNAALAVLHGRELTGSLGEAAELLALLAGQDVGAGEGGEFS